MVRRLRLPRQAASKEASPGGRQGVPAAGGAPGAPAGPQPRPIRGILVAITVMNGTFAPGGRLAM